LESGKICSGRRSVAAVRCDIISVVFLECGAVGLLIYLFITRINVKRKMLARARFSTLFYSFAIYTRGF
jgi:hypothetical protein